jgi:gliding motility-associated-like protein
MSAHKFFFFLIAFGIGQNCKSQLAYIPNRNANSLSIVNLSTNSVVATLPVGILPTSVTINKVLNKVYVGNQGNGSNGSITVINACTNTIEATITGFGPGQPSGIACSPNGQRLYVPMYQGDNMKVVNTATNAIIATIPVGAGGISSPEQCVVSPDNARVYLDLFDEDRVAFIDAITNTVIAYYATDSRPTGVEVSNDGTKLYVANQNSNTLIIYNTTTGARIATITLAPIPSPFGDGGAAGITLNHANTKVYVSIQDISTVKVVDLSTNTVTGSVNVGSRPFGIDILNDDSKVYASCVYGDRIDGINTVTNAVVVNIPVGDGPYSYGKFILKKNIDSVKILSQPTTCNGFNFQGQAFINGTPITNWQWFFGDGGTDNVQNTSHTYLTGGSYTVKLVVTDANGCKDSTTKDVSTSIVAVNAGNDSTVCRNSTFNLLANGSGIVSYAWSPPALVSNPAIANPTTNLSATQKFYCTVTNGAGCSTTDSVTYTVQSVNVNTTDNTSICSGSSLQVNTTGASTYSWSPIAGLSNPLIPNPLATPTVTTKYYVTGTSALGCTGTDSITITLLTPPIVVTNPDTSICTGISIQLNTSGAVTYSWSPAAGLSNAAIPNPIAAPLIPTQYIVTGTASNGCTANDTVNIGLKPLPVISKSNDTTICTAGSAQLYATGGAAYSWTPTTGLNNPGIPNPTASPTNSTVYKVAVTGANSCVKLDSVSVAVNPLPVYSVSAPSVICNNSSVQLSAGGGDLYLWSPASGLSNAAVANPIATPNATTPYSVRIISSVCHDTAFRATVVTVNPQPNITATKSNDISCSFPTVQLLATGAVNYVWSPSAGLSNPLIANPVATISGNTTYTVTGTDLNGCTSSKTITVMAAFVAGGNLYIPNAFTPNGDGKNDCFGVRIYGTVNIFELSVFNRYGERIFYTTDASKCWDGTYKSKRQQVGGYVYVVTANTSCGNFFRKGNFILIR